ncbi:unnamed protein product [Ectocarpus sp. 6 AP-2014]
MCGMSFCLFFSLFTPLHLHTRLSLLLPAPLAFVSVSFSPLQLLHARSSLLPHPLPTFRFLSLLPQYTYMPAYRCPPPPPVPVPEPGPVRTRLAPSWLCRDARSMV